MSRPRLLDLFCGAGGASMGYYRAGFDVFGVDIEEQPNYPFPFRRADALRFPLGKFDAIHASPPCQAHSSLKALWRDREHPDLVEPTRQALQESGVPYVIENVVGAPLENPITLCGSMFGLDVRRHRLFETSFPILAPPCSHGYQSEAKYLIQEHGKHTMSPVVRVYGSGGGKANEHWDAAMGISWMNRSEIAQAIPPAYTEFIGRELLAQIRVEHVRS